MSSWAWYVRIKPLMRLAHRSLGVGRGLGTVCEAGVPLVRLGVRWVGGRKGVGDTLRAPSDLC